jgi:hypothetical protein
VSDDVKAFFERLRLSPRSYNNFLGALRTFFAFAQNQGWPSKEADLLARIEKRKEKGAPVEIFLPSELTALLEYATEDLTPGLTLAAFAGLRMEEILRLEWTAWNVHRDLLLSPHTRLRLRRGGSCRLATISQTGWPHLKGAKVESGRTVSLGSSSPCGTRLLQSTRNERRLENPPSFGNRTPCVIRSLHTGSRRFGT